MLARNTSTPLAVFLVHFVAVVVVYSNARVWTKEKNTDKDYNTTCVIISHASITQRETQNKRPQGKHHEKIAGLGNFGRTNEKKSRLCFENKGKPFFCPCSNKWMYTSIRPHWTAASTAFVSASVLSLFLCLRDRLIALFTFLHNLMKGITLWLK